MSPASPKPGFQAIQTLPSLRKDVMLDLLDGSRGTPAIIPRASTSSALGAINPSSQGSRIGSNEIDLNLNQTSSQRVESLSLPRRILASTTTAAASPSSNVRREQFRNRFGFIKQESLYGNGKGEGALNNEHYILSIKKFVKERNSLSPATVRPRSKSVLEIMEQHIETTNRLQRKFIEESASQSTSAIAIASAAAAETLNRADDTTIINKLTQHLFYHRDRKEIEDMIKAEMSKQNFNPSDDPLDNQNNSEFYQDDFGVFDPPISKYNKKKSLSSQLSSVHAQPAATAITTADVINKDESQVNNHNSQIVHEKQPEEEEDNSVSGENNNNPGIEAGAAVADIAEAAEQKKKKKNQNSSQNNNNNSNKGGSSYFSEGGINGFGARARQRKQDLQHRMKLDGIIADHAKNIKEIDFVYSDVTEETKRFEIAKRQRRLEELQEQYLQKKQQQVAVQGIVAAGNSQVNAKANWKNLTGFVRSNVRQLAATTLKPSSGNPTASTPAGNSNGGPPSLTPGTSAIEENQQSNGTRAKGNTNLSQESSGKSIGWAKLEQQKKLAKESKLKSDEDSKVFFEPKFKSRYKELLIDLTREGCKEQVLDRVMMNYFHQEDLLKEQRALFRKALAARRVKDQRAQASAAGTTGTSQSIPSVGSAKAHHIKEFSKMLKQFEPTQLRLKMEDIKRSSSSNNSRNRSSSSSNWHQRSKYATAKFEDNYGGSNTLQQQQITTNSSFSSGRAVATEGDDDSNIDVDIYKMQYAWKKKQNEVINYSKICSPAQMVTQFMHQDPLYKKQANIEIIDFLVQFDPNKNLASSDGMQATATGGAAASTADQEAGEYQHQSRMPGSSARASHVFSMNSTGYSAANGGGVSGFFDPFAKQQKNIDLQRNINGSNNMNVILHRCFFYFSNKTDSATGSRFQEINYEGFLKFFYMISGKNSSSQQSLQKQQQQQQQQSNQHRSSMSSQSSQVFPSGVTASAASAVSPGVGVHNSNISGNAAQSQQGGAAVNQQSKKQQSQFANNKIKKPEIRLSFFVRVVTEMIRQRQQDDFEQQMAVEEQERKERHMQEKLLGTHLTVEIVKGIFEKTTHGQEKAVLSYFLFLQAIRKASIVYYMPSELQQEDAAVSCGNENVQPQPQELFERFYKEFIAPISNEFRETNEREVLDSRRMYSPIHELLVLFEKNLHDLFVFAGSMRSINAFECSQIYLTFTDLFEIVSKLELFPDLISKNSLRYIYFYSVTEDQGLSERDFAVCFHLIAITVMRATTSKRKTPVATVMRDVQSIREFQLTMSRLKGNLRGNAKIPDNIIKFVQDICAFYVHKDFLDINNINKRIFTIKDSLQKQMQFIL